MVLLMLRRLIIGYLICGRFLKAHNRAWHDEVPTCKCCLRRNP